MQARLIGMIAGGVVVVAAVVVIAMSAGDDGDTPDSPNGAEPSVTS
ncbi:MAG: hypothetical protein HKN91_07185, partial [Acidimicrobiia bacterium]|nr:hypothetical protein [Acidimicrobiia bacterium]